MLPSVVTREIVSVPPLPLNISDVPNDVLAVVPVTIKVSLPEPPYKLSLALALTLFG